MSFVQKKNTNKKNNNNGLLNKISLLEEKINNTSSFNQENKIKMLEEKILKLEKLINTKNTKSLTNVINDDLNKLKIKIDKNESIIKKLLFN